MHPNCPSLYVIAASHELKQQSHSAARVLLQRGIRMNSENVDLWTQYVQMELGFADLLRRRWTVLGLHKDDGSKVDRDAELDQQADLSLEKALPEDEEDEAARREILNGALVKEVISNAVKCVCCLFYGDEADSSPSYTLCGALHVNPCHLHDLSISQVSPTPTSRTFTRPSAGNAPGASS